MNYVIASISSYDDLRDRLATSKEDYYSIFDFERPKSSRSNIDTMYNNRYKNGLSHCFCRRESGIFCCFVFWFFISQHGDWIVVIRFCGTVC